MIAFKDIGTFILQQDANNLRIYDMHKNCILDISEPTAQAAVTKLNSIAPMLSSYGKLTIKGGNDGHKAKHFTGADAWLVYFENAMGTTWANQGAMQMQQPQNSGMNMQLLNTMVELEKIKVQMIADKEKRELEEKYKKKDTLPVPMEYLPFIGEFLGWSDEKMFKKLQMSAMAGNLSGLGTMMQSNTTPAVAGAQLSFQGTKEEKEKVMQKLWDDIGEKVDGEKMFKILNAINKKPEFADMAVQFVNAQGLSGTDTPAEQKQIEVNFSSAPMAKAEDEKF